MYKKVAMVEQFFDIIYSVHVEAAGENQLRGRAGKHCGQKRTYRAVSISLSVKILNIGQIIIMLIKCFFVVVLYHCRWPTCMLLFHEKRYQSFCCIV